MNHPKYISNTFLRSHHHDARYFVYLTRNVCYPHHSRCYYHDSLRYFIDLRSSSLHLWIILCITSPIIFSSMVQSVLSYHNIPNRYLRLQSLSSTVRRYICKRIIHVLLNSCIENLFFGRLMDIILSSSNRYLFSETLIYHLVLFRYPIMMTHS